jgi:Fe-S-cluster containining protein
MQETETRRISEVTAKPVEEFSIKIEGREPYVYEMKKTREGKCVFIKESMCTVYALRPLICRFYPFELKTQKNGKYAFTCTAECPGLRKGRCLPKAYFENLFQTLDARSDFTGY